MIWSLNEAASSNSNIFAASFMAFSRRAISAAFSCLVMALTLPWRSSEATSSAVAEISSSYRTDLTTVLGVMPWALL